MENVMKLRRRKHRARRGAILVLIVICLVALMACVALAIDLGMIMAARTQVVAAADGAAMAGARALNGNTTSGANNNYAGVLPAAQQAVTANSVLSTPLTNGQVSVNIGRYTYNTSAQRFEGQFPGPSGENWSMVQATVNVPSTNCLAFSKVFNFSPTNLVATATAVHRPRDVAIILDFSGSMQFQSLAGGYYDGTNYCNNPDTSVPRFGHYSSVGAGTLWATSFNSPYDAANTTTTTSDGRPPIVQDFYSDANGTPAWTAASASYGTTPAGDNFLKTNKNAGATYAQTAAQVLNIASPGTSTRDSAFESSGYTAYGMANQFNGYTRGPAYWGKTFFVWPPNPVSDWRKLYFRYPGTSTPMDDNFRLWRPAETGRRPAAAIIRSTTPPSSTSLRMSAPIPFPARSGPDASFTTPVSRRASILRPRRPAI
jgi:Flp pilus assembly protein TadG